MFKVFRWLPIVAIAVMATGCSRNSPKEVAKTWLTAFNRLDADGAMKLSSSATKNLINSLSELSGPVPDSTLERLKDITVDIKDVKEEGNKATVTYTTSDNPRERTLLLVLLGDKWVVQFTKLDLARDLAEAGEEATESAPAPAAPDSTVTISVGSPANQ
jgi:hypothetical protein